MYFIVALLGILVCVPISASAHQPRIVEGTQTQVIEPAISKAYYGQLKGTPDIFTIHASSSFPLYVNVLVPDIKRQQQDVSATITKDGQTVAVLDGTQFTWKAMFESFGYDNYFQGPEYKAPAEAGTYTIAVSSTNNDSKYSLAIGEAENFDLKEINNALTLVPQLKRDFFEESPISFILSPFGWGLILVLYVLAAIFGFAYRYVLKKFAKQSSVRKASKNIGTPDRLLRFLIGIGLLLLAITTTWSPLLIFFSGFALFESFFSWCGFYAAIGRSTCPIE
jgi:Protein of unknown function (DUF2892)